MVFTWAPLSKRAIQLPPFILTLATFLTPYSHRKGSRFKKGVWRAVFMPWEPPSGGSLWHLLLLEGSGLPLSMLSPPSHLTVSYVWKSLQMGNCRWDVLGFYSGSNISHLLGHLSQPLPNEQWTPQSPLQLCWDHHFLDLHHCLHPLLLNVSSTQQAFQEGLVTLKFPHGEETSSPWLGGTISSLGSGALGQVYRIFLLSLKTISLPFMQYRLNE